jgi:hypothetical protein
MKRKSLLLLFPLCVFITLAQATDNSAAPASGSLYYAIPTTFNRSIKPLEIFLPMSYALLAG